MQKRIECKITGRVQMVLFRDFARRKAVKLGVVGFARNEPDGGVFVAAEGEEEKLKEFIEYLKKGPALARVDKVDMAWEKPTSEFSDFRIEY